MSYSEVFSRCKCGGVIAKHNSNRGMTICMECWNKQLKIEALENVVFHDVYHSLATVHKAKIELAKLKEGV